MIYTVTLNPAVDYLLELDEFNVGRLNRSRYQHFSAGGKGINVSLVLNELKVPSVATGFIGGFTGHFILNHLNEKKIQHQFIEIKDTTRVNIKLEVLEQTEINARAPKVTDSEFENFLSLIYQCQPNDLLVLAGSSIEDRNAYLKIVKIALEKSIPFVVDVEKNTLKQLLPFQPELVKPNLYELETFVGSSLETEEKILKASQTLLDMGAKRVIVSLGKEGSYYHDSNQIFHAPAVPGVAKNAVGAGDSMIAGFLSEMHRSNDSLKAYQMAVAAGTATAFSYDLGTYEEIHRLIKDIQIRTIKS